MISKVIFLVLTSFVLGFLVGKQYIVNGLSLRVKQLHEEGDEKKAKLIEEILGREGEKRT